MLNLHLTSYGYYDQHTTVNVNISKHKTPSQSDTRDTKQHKYQQLQAMPDLTIIKAIPAASQRSTDISVDIGKVPSRTELPLGRLYHSSSPSPDELKPKQNCQPQLSEEIITTVFSCRKNVLLITSLSEL